MTKKQKFLKDHGYIPQVGRPQVGDVMLPGIIVSNEIKSGLDALAKKSGRSVPDIRREIYQKALER